MMGQSPLSAFRNLAESNLGLSETRPLHFFWQKRGIFVLLQGLTDNISGTGPVQVINVKQLQSCDWLNFKRSNWHHLFQV